jgi:hypothetical protein
MKILYSLLLASLMYIPVQAQSWITRNGKISFYSKTPMEDIKAVNSQVFAAIDVPKKTIAFTLLLKNFLFEKQLMQDHFNENYVESDKYPKATFSGTVTGNIGTAPGVYKVQIDGKLTLHGVTQPVSMPAELELKDGKLLGKSTFNIKPSDYKIQIPSLVKEKIAAEIPVQVSAEFLPAK